MCIRDRTTHWPRSADYPTEYSTDYPTDYSTDYPPRTTLNNQTNYFYGEEKHKKPTCSHVHDHNSVFHFRPILHRPPASETLFRQWMIGRRCWIFLFLICLKCLPSTLKAHIHPKCIAPRARQIWISCDTKLSNLLRSVIIVFFHYNRILHI